MECVLKFNHLLKDNLKHFLYYTFIISQAFKETTEGKVWGMEADTFIPMALLSYVSKSLYTYLSICLRSLQSPNNWFFTVPLLFRLKISHYSYYSTACNQTHNPTGYRLNDISLHLPSWIKALTSYSFLVILFALAPNVWSWRKE